MKRKRAVARRKPLMRLNRWDLACGHIVTADWDMKTGQLILETHCTHQSSTIRTDAIGFLAPSQIGDDE